MPLIAGGHRGALLAGSAGGVAGALAVVGVASLLGAGASSSVQPAGEVSPLELRASSVRTDTATYVAVDFEARLQRLIFSNVSGEAEAVLIGQYLPPRDRLVQRSVLVVPANETVTIEGRFEPRRAGVDGARPAGVFHRVLARPGAFAETLFVTGIDATGLIHEVVAFDAGE